ncbi:MAG: hypothetical protein RLZZ618_3172 [Pseudomonadota bacterium]|jgi:hypothetical protein
MNTRSLRRSGRFAALAVFMVTGVTAHAQSLRCQGALAEVGDTKYAVLQKCGEPAFKDGFCKPLEVWVPTGRGGYRVPPQALPCQWVDEWSYNPGPGYFVAIVRFESGAVSGIRTGDRVR